MENSVQRYGWSERWASVVSMALHPALVALWMVVMTMVGWASPLDYPKNVQLFVIGNTAFITLLMPVAFLWLQRVLIRHRGGEMTLRRGRVSQLAMMVVSYVACGWMFDEIVVLYLVRKVMYTLAVVAFVVLAMEYVRPLSHHTALFGALVGMIWMLLYVGNVALFTPFVAAILCGGLLLTSRLMLGENLFATWGGFFGGLAVALIVFVLI